MTALPATGLPLYRQIATEIRERIRSGGLAPGDRVVLVAENRPEWLIADYAVMAAGLVTVPAYVTNTVDDHRYIINNVGARAVIVSTARTAIGTSRKGTLADLAASDLAVAAIGGLVERAGIPVDDVDDLQMGESLQGGGDLAGGKAKPEVAGDADYDGRDEGD